jgi:hypothetical protein
MSRPVTANDMIEPIAKAFARRRESKHTPEEAAEHWESYRAEATELLAIVIEVGLSFHVSDGSAEDRAMAWSKGYEEGFEAEAASSDSEALLYRFGPESERQLAEAIADVVERRGDTWFDGMRYRGKYLALAAAILSEIERRRMRLDPGGQG